VCSSDLEVGFLSGIRNAEAKQLAQKSNLPYVENRCIMVEHMHHQK
jgi:predicted CoA-binding protein